MIRACAREQLFSYFSFRNPLFYVLLQSERRVKMEQFELIYALLEGIKSSLLLDEVKKDEIIVVITHIQERIKANLVIVDM